MLKKFDCIMNLFMCLNSIYTFSFSICLTAANQELKYSQSKAINMKKYFKTAYKLN